MRAVDEEYLFFLFSFQAVSASPCLSFGPVCLPTDHQTQIQFSRPRSPETTIYSFKQTLLLLFFLLSSSSSSSAFPFAARYSFLSRTDAASGSLVNRENLKISKLPCTWELEEWAMYIHGVQSFSYSREHKRTPRYCYCWDSSMKAEAFYHSLRCILFADRKV